MGYYLLDNPNPNAAQYAYPRRSGRKPSGTIIVHTAEGNGRAGVQRFIANRSDYGSYHRLSDDTGTTKLLPFDYEAWQDTETNGWGIGISAACFAADWKRMPAAKADAILRNLARAAAEAVEYMRAVHGVNVPIRRISGAQARAGVPGFCAHGDSGFHRSDPGADFNWDLFFTYINQQLGGIYAASIITQEDDMPYLDWPEKDRKALAKDVNGYVRNGEKVDLSHMVKYIYDAIKRVEKLAKAATPAKFWAHGIASRFAGSRGEKFSAQSHIGVINEAANLYKRDRLEQQAQLKEIVDNTGLSTEDKLAALTAAIGTYELKLVPTAAVEDLEPAEEPEAVPETPEEVFTPVAEEAK